jgi:hypothetical protein
MHILNNFEMTYCKPIPTVTLMNMKKQNETSSDSGEIDQHIYRHMIASLMYLVNIGPDIGYAVNVLSQFESTEKNTLDSSEACVEIFARHN